MVKTLWIRHTTRLKRRAPARLFLTCGSLYSERISNPDGVMLAAEGTIVNAPIRTSERPTQRE